LKLAARADDLPALARALAARAGSAGKSVRLVSIYYDSDDQMLARRGLALRVRQVEGSFVQTVKSAAGGGSALARGEWEDAIAGPQPDPNAPESGHFLEDGVAERLAPLFRTEVDRQVLDLSCANAAHVEAAIDRGRIVADAAAADEPISEIELELKSGTPAALYDLALDLLAITPLRLEWRSKAERGYRLVAGDGAAVAAVHARPVDLDPALDGNAALRRIGLACLEQISRNDAAVLAGLDDGIHQMRVGVRRLRAILSAFKRHLPTEQRRWASTELRWLADALGPARNLDVFDNTLLAKARPELNKPAALQPLDQAVARRRRAAYRMAAAAIRCGRYTGLMLRLLRWLDGCGWREGEPAKDVSADLRQPTAAVADRVLTHCWRAAKKRSRGFADQAPRRRHELRIALKKLRYTIDSLAGLYDAEAVAPFTKRLKRLQDELGDANDVEVGHAIVAKLAKPDARGRAIAGAGKRVLQWHAARLSGRENRLRKDLHRLLAAEPFWHQ
jgi:triphosphatase